MTRLLDPPQLPENAALFLDFDGTLAPLQDDPKTVFLSEDQLSLIAQLSEQLSGALALISGRDVRDLSSRTLSSVWRAGSHGLEILRCEEAPTDTPEPAPDELDTRINALIAKHSGTWLEQKGEVLAIHYRQAPQAENALCAALTDILTAFPDYKGQNGKFVLEAKPQRANKGFALQNIMMSDPFQGRTPLMVGDDTTDEDAMKVANQLNGWSIKVGEGDTVAKYRLACVADVWTWLSKGRK